MSLKGAVNLNMYSEYRRIWILALDNENKTPTEIVIILQEENIVVVRTTVTGEPGKKGKDSSFKTAVSAPKASSPMKKKIDKIYRQDPEYRASELRAQKAAGWICIQTCYCRKHKTCFLNKKAHHLVQQV